MFRAAMLTGAAALAFSTITMLPAPPARAGIEDVFDTLEEFDDIAECDYVIRKVRVKVKTPNGYRWVWVRKRVKECDD